MKTENCPQCKHPLFTIGANLCSKCGWSRNNEKSFMGGYCLKCNSVKAKEFKSKYPDGKSYSVWLCFDCFAKNCGGYELKPDDINYYLELCDGDERWAERRYLYAKAHNDYYREKWQNDVKKWYYGVRYDDKNRK